MLKKKNKKTNVLIVYPWEDVLHPSCGATLRLTLLIQYLKDFFDQITVLYSNGESTRIDNVRYIGFKQTKIAFLFSRLIRKSIKLFFRFFYSELLDGNELNHLWLCFRYRFDRQIKKLFKEEIHKADFIIMKYFYFSSLVFPEARREQKKVIVADYDVVTNQFSKRHAKSAILRRELYALKRADISVVLTESDKNYFMQKGISNIEVIYNGIDLAKVLSNKYDKKLACLLLAQNFNISIDEDENICLFVGSAFKCNIKAVQRIKEIAEQYYLLQGNKTKFIVCGSCHPVVSERNFISTGYSDSFLLHLLYQVSDFILIPLEEGTGASIKTIEAFSYGKFIIGTDIAFRGLEVSSGNNCIVSNEINVYPYLIKKYIENPDAKNLIESNSLLLGKKMDYKVYNQNYLHIFDNLKIDYNKQI